MNCDYCHRPIPDGQEYNCITESIEKLVDGVIVTTRAHIRKISCVICTRGSVLMHAIVPLRMPQIRVLGSWASLSRTFDCALKAIEGDADYVDIATSELQSLRRPLDDLMGAVRDEVQQWRSSDVIAVFAAYAADRDMDEAIERLMELGWPNRSKARTDLEGSV